MVQYLHFRILKFPLINDGIYSPTFPHNLQFTTVYHDKSVWIKKHCAFSKNTHDFNGDFTLHIGIHPEVHQRFGFWVRARIKNH